MCSFFKMKCRLLIKRKILPCKIQNKMFLFKNPRWLNVCFSNFSAWEYSSAEQFPLRLLYLDSHCQSLLRPQTLLPLRRMAIHFSFKVPLPLVPQWFSLLSNGSLDSLHSRTSADSAPVFSLHLHIFEGISERDSF